MVEKTTNNHPWRFHPQLVLRTPYYPFTLNITEEIIIAQLNNPAFMEAIYLASPVLYDTCKKLKEGSIISEKEKQKIIFSLTKYYTRMSSRSTPFGLFSGCGVVNWAPQPTRVVRHSSKTARHTRLDMQYLCGLAQHLALLPFIKQQLTYYPNSSIYDIGAEIRYVEYQYINGKRHHQITAIPNPQGQWKLLLQSIKQGVTWQALIAKMEALNYTAAEAIELANTFIEAQLLTNNLEPSVTGEEFIFQIIKTLRAINTKQEAEISNIIQTLLSVCEKLPALDEQTGNPILRYQQIVQALNTLQVPFEESKLFQTDMVTVCEEGSIDETCQKNIEAALLFLQKTTKPTENENLKAFAKRYTQLYEAQQMPLLEVLDTESGIGYLANKGRYVSPLLEQTAFLNQPTAFQFTIGQWEKLLSNKLEQAGSQASTIYLNDDDIKNFSDQKIVLPPSLSVLFRVVDSAANLIYLESAGGSSAVNLLGRFAHGNEAVHNIIQYITKVEQEKNEDVLFAEIVHLPESRVGNILLRPILRQYEIPYLAASSLPAEKQITVDDLYISVKNETVYLYSKKMNKRIIPRLSTAHNYSNNALPVYQFLCDLQGQGVQTNFNFSWSGLGKLNKKLPRVVYGNNVILEPASWSFEQSDFQALFNQNKILQQKAIAAFREKWQIPRFFILSDSDNELLVDFESDLLVQTWLDVIEDRKYIILKEFISIANNGVTNKLDSKYAHQLVALLINEKAVYSAVNNSKQEKNGSLVQRSFIPGSEWIYYKIYCGEKLADKIGSMSLLGG